MRSKRTKNAEGNLEKDNDSVNLMENEMEKENEYSGNDTNRSVNKRRKSPHVYTVDDDVDILFAIQKVKPFGKNSTEISWKQVHDQVSHIKSDWKSKKNRFMNEIKRFTANENKSKRGSGVVETYDLKDKLLTEILPLMKEAEDKTLSTSDRNKRARDKASSEGIRMTVMSSMASKTLQQKSISNDPDEDILETEVLEFNVTPKLKRRKDDILELIRVKELASQKTREEELCIKREKLDILKLEKNSEMEERNRKLAFEERRLALEEKKLEFEMMKYRDNKTTGFFHSV